MAAMMDSVSSEWIDTNVARIAAVLNFGVGYHASEIREMYGDKATEGFSIVGYILLFRK